MEHVRTIDIILLGILVSSLIFNLVFVIRNRRTKFCDQMSYGAMVIMVVLPVAVCCSMFSFAAANMPHTDYVFRKQIECLSSWPMITLIGIFQSSILITGLILADKFMIALKKNTPFARFNQGIIKMSQREFGRSNAL